MKLHNYLRLLIPGAVVLSLLLTVTAEGASGDVASQYATLAQNGSKSPQEWFAVAAAAHSAATVTALQEVAELGFTSVGTLTGHNAIERQERGCVLIDRGENLSGGTGMRFNYLDKVTDEWVQIWNAEGGGQINIRGGLTAVGMRLEGQLHTIGNGSTVPFRALWTPLPDGRVGSFLSNQTMAGRPGCRGLKASIPGPNRRESTT